MQGLFIYICINQLTMSSDDKRNTQSRKHGNFCAIRKPPSSDIFLIWLNKVTCWNWHFIHLLMPLALIVHEDIFHFKKQYWTRWINWSLVADIETENVIGEKSEMPVALVKAAVFSTLCSVVHGYSKVLLGRTHHSTAVFAVISG